jgi:hypothetical protein
MRRRAPKRPNVNIGHVTYRNRGMQWRAKHPLSKTSDHGDEASSADTRPVRRGGCAHRIEAGRCLTAAETFEVNRSDGDWRKLLTPMRYVALSQSGTERPFTSPLLHDERRGAAGIEPVDRAGHLGRAHFGRVTCDAAERI